MKETIPSKEQLMQIRSQKLKLNMAKHEIRSFKIRKQDVDRLQSVEFVIGSMSVVHIEQPMLSALPVKDGLVELLADFTSHLPSHASIPEYNAYFVYTYKVDYYTSTPIVKTKMRLMDVPHYQSFCQYVLTQVDEYSKINGIYKTLEDVSKLLTSTKEDVSVKRHKVDTPQFTFEAEERVTENETYEIKHPLLMSSGDLAIGVPVVMKEYDLDITPSPNATKKRVDEFVLFGNVGEEVVVGDKKVPVVKHPRYADAHIVKLPEDAWDAWETVTLQGEGVVSVFIEQPNLLGVKDGMLGCKYTS